MLENQATYQSENSYLIFSAKDVLSLGKKKVTEKLMLWRK